MSAAEEERRYAWLELTHEELLSIVRGERRIAELAPDGIACDAEILAVRPEVDEKPDGGFGVVRVRLGLCSISFFPCAPEAEPPTVDWKPEPIPGRQVKFREFF